MLNTTNLSKISQHATLGWGIVVIFRGKVAQNNLFTQELMPLKMNFVLLNLGYCVSS